MASSVVGRQLGRLITAAVLPTPAAAPAAVAATFQVPVASVNSSGSQWLIYRLDVLLGALIATFNGRDLVGFGRPRREIGTGGDFASAKTMHLGGAQREPTGRH